MADSCAIQLHNHDDASSSQSNKLCLKIKFPSSGEGEGHIICEYCGKRFSSGKAWGGHKRHHLQEKKKQQRIQQELKLIKKEKKMMMKNKKKRCRAIYAGDVTIKNGTPICCLCYKVFPSLNSLFGHMRFHPERDWRGIQPPEAEPEPEAEAEDGRSIDLLSDLAGWKKKDKRGRVCIPDQAAHNLITLSRDRAQSEVFENENLMVDSSVTEDGEYNCDIRKKKFATGQALGHWKPDIDLNKPFHDDEDELEILNLYL